MKEPFRGQQNEKLGGNLRERQARPTLLMEYRGHISDRFSRSIRKSTQACVLFTTRKMKTVLPSLKSKIPDDLKSRVIYEITCSGCYVDMLRTVPATPHQLTPKFWISVKIQDDY